LRFPGSDVAHFDIHQTSTSILHSIYAICLSKLIQFKVGADVVQPGLIPVPDLAESWTQPDDVTYVCNMRSGVKWQNIPPADGRRFTILPAAATTQAASSARELDVYSIVSDQKQVDELKKSLPDITVSRIPPLATAELGMEVDSGPTQDVRVRRAVSKAMDRQ